MAKTKSKKTRLSKNVKTRFGSVNRKALERLRDSYDPWTSLAVINAIDHVRKRGDDMRETAKAVHRMAMNLINTNYAAPGSGIPDEPVWELADRITGDLLECIAHLKKAYKAVEPLTKLTPHPDGSEAPDYWQA